MSATVEKLSSNQVKLTVTVSAQDFEQAMNTAYGKLKGRLTVPGFRKGKAPRKIIENYYGAGVLVEEAFNTVLPDSYDKAVEETGIQPVAQPEIDLETIGAGEDCVYTATVYVRPEVTLGQYKGIAVPAAKWEVKPEQVQAEIDRAAERVSRMVEVTDRAAQNGDTTNINYAGTVDGVAFAGGTAENQNLVLGSGMFIPGFEEQVVGMNVGEEKDVNVTFPEDYHAKDLAGKAAVFHVKVNKLSVTIVPAIDDELAKDVSEFETLEELKADIRAKKLEQMQKQLQTAFEQAVVEKVAENATVDVPDALVDAELDQQMQNFAYQLQMSGYSVEQYAKMMGGDMSTLRQAFKPAAEKQAKANVVLEKVAEVENITVSDEEVESELAEMAKQYEMELEKVKELVPTDEITTSLKTRKTIAFLTEHAVAAAPKAE